MLWVVSLILLANWVLGLLSGAQLGWWIHLMFAGALLSAALAALSSAKGPGRRGGPSAGEPNNRDLEIP